MHEILVERLRRGLAKAIKELPPGFYDTFKYTTTGMNLSHPVTLGLLAKLVGEMKGIGYVGIDVRLNQGKGSNKLKFQPDIVGYQDAEALKKNEAAIIVDFESPNSSDARLTQHHLEDYIEWVKDFPERLAPYVIITSLPNAAAPEWELRYTSPTGVNRKHKGKRELIRVNPFQYWIPVWKNVLAKRLAYHAGLGGVFFLNINGNKVVQIQLAGN